MTFYVQITDSVKECPEELFELGEPLGKLAKRVGEAVLSNESIPEDVYAELTITDNDTIRIYNRDYRDIDSETDVLSFPGLSFETPGVFVADKALEASYRDPDSGLIALGDIIISADRVISQAKEYGHSRKRELSFLIAHSMLHLCGYDHLTPDEEERMIQKQEAALLSLGIVRE